jgi:hypothetical protein
MAKYDPLKDRLRDTRGDEVRLSFKDIEALIGAGLPKGAREKRTWWANDDTGHAAAWTTAGFEADVDLDSETVVYRRAGSDEGGYMDHAYELYETGVEQARELFAAGAGQVREAWGRASPTVRKTAPWVLLGAGVLLVLGVFVQRGMKDRG